MFQKIVLTLFVVLASAGLLLAQQEPATPPAGAAPAVPQNSQIQGVINKIDLQSKVITVRDEASGQTQEVLFDETTSFSIQNKSGSAQEIKQDDRVTIEVDSTNTAVRVTVDSAETEPAPGGEQQNS